MKITNIQRNTPDFISFVLVHDDNRNFTTGKSTRPMLVERPAPGAGATLNAVIFNELDALLRADYEYIMSLPLPSEIKDK
jgi:hypothetical protein